MKSDNGRHPNERKEELPCCKTFSSEIVLIQPLTDCKHTVTIVSMTERNVVLQLGHFSGHSLQRTKNGDEKSKSSCAGIRVE